MSLEDSPPLIDSCHKPLRKRPRRLSNPPPSQTISSTISTETNTTSHHTTCTTTTTAQQLDSVSSPSNNAVVSVSLSDDDTTTNDTLAGHTTKEKEETGEIESASHKQQESSPLPEAKEGCREKIPSDTAPPVKAVIHHNHNDNDNISPSTESALVESPSTSNSNEVLLQSVTVGCRVAVYWDGEDAYFEGTITQERNHPKRPFYILYDDGDQEWIDLSQETFRILSVPIDIKGRVPDVTQLVHTPVTKEESPDVEKEDCKSTVTEKSSNGKDTTPDTKPSKASAKKLTNRKAETLAAGKPKQKMIKTSVRVKTTKSNAAKTPTASSLTKVSDTKVPSKTPSNDYSDDWVRAGISRSEDSSDSETDEDEVMEWGARLFGITQLPRIARRKTTSTCSGWSGEMAVPISEAVKLGRRRRTSLNDVEPVLTAEMEKEAEARRKKEESRPLSNAEIKAWLSKDLCAAEASVHWVRRSVRQPSRSALNSPQVRALLDKLRGNAFDMVVLKLKKYIPDPNAPQIVLDATLDALEENTNCESLYIQVSNFVSGLKTTTWVKLLKLTRLFVHSPLCRISMKVCEMRKFSDCWKYCNVRLARFGV